MFFISRESGNKSAEGLGVILISILLIMILTACENSNLTADKKEYLKESNLKTENDKDNNLENEDQAKLKNELKVEDIDWHVEDSILDGYKILSLNYTNNSNYTIMDVEITFRQKEGITKEQLSVFDEYKSMRDFTDDEVAEIYILGYNRKCARPGETVKDSPLVLNGTYYPAEDMAQYELMEPESISIAFIGNDDKGYVMYYDYKSQIYGSSTHDGTDIHQWSQKELCNLIDVPDCPAVKVDIDENDSFWFTAYGMSKEMFKEYVEDLKSKGFTKDAEEDDDLYQGENEDGIKVDVSYSVVEESMDVSLEKE